MLKSFFKKGLFALTTSVITNFPVFAGCLTSNPELYDYTGQYVANYKTISLEITTPSGKKECNLIPREEAILLGGEELFKRNNNPTNNKTFDYRNGSIAIAKCEHLLVHMWDTTPESIPVWEFDEKGFDVELRIVPYVPKVSKLIWANVTAWEETRSKQGFGTTSVYALKSERNCKKDGEYYTINRKFVAQTHGSEEIYTRHVTYLKIGSQ